MGVIVPFAKPAPKGRAPSEPLHRKLGGPALARGTVHLLKVSLAFVRYTLFLVLMFLRGPLRAILGVLGGLSILAFLFVAAGLDSEDPNKAMFLWALGGASFGSFVVTWFYDALLLRLSPDTPIILT